MRKTVIRRSILILAAAALVILCLSIAGGKAHAAAVSKTIDGVGTVTVNGLDNIKAGTKSVKLTITVESASGADAYFATEGNIHTDDVNINRNSTVTLDSTKKKATYELGLSTTPAGTYTLTVTVDDAEARWGAVGQINKAEFDLNVYPAKPTFRASNIKTTYNSVTFYTGNWSDKNGDKIELWYVDSKNEVHYLTGFLTSSTVNTVTAKGLKPNTSYKLLAVGYTKGPGYGDLSSYVTVKTGPAKKLSISSVKISGVKVKTTPRRWYPGHWSGNIWIKGHYYGGTSTTYTVTVKLKSRHSGMKGILINGEKASGSGKTFKKTVSETGNQRGKSKYFQICSYQNSNYLGTSMTVTKKATVR